MSYRQIFFHSISYLIILSIYVLLIPQTEQPDGMLHYGNYKLIFNELDFTFHTIYFYIFSFFDVFFMSLGFDDFCSLGFTFDIQNCYGAHYYSEEITKNLEIFGKNIKLFSYNYKFSIFSFQISLITYHFLLFLIIIIFSKICRLNQSIVYLIIIFFLMPSVILSYAYLSPNTLSIFFHLFVFISLINKKYFITLFLILLSIYFDNQNIILGFFLINFIVIYNVLKKYNNIRGYLIILISIVLISVFCYSILNLYISDTDLAYLNQSSFTPIKSLITMYLSLYYMGGSMSYLSFELEYLFYFLFIIFFIFDNFKLSIEKTTLHLCIFIAINITFFQILSVLPSVDQGRYYFILLINLIYFFTKEYKKIIIENFNLVIFTIYLLNMIKIIKIYLIIYV